MNTFITNENQIYTYVLERYTFACRNYSHHSATSDYVRHRTLSKDIARSYLVAVKDIRKVPSVFWGVVEPTFSTTEVLL